MSSTFHVQAYSQDGQLLSESTLDAANDNVATLRCAENSARGELASRCVEPVIVVVTEETLTKLRQVQFRLAASSRP